MKAMQCELCGATDIIKVGDFFVCQSCGMRYTPENAKKMMVEGVVQVEGTVKIDASQQVENYISLAENAHSSNNEREAEDYANKVLEIEPHHYRALYIKGEAAGWQTSGCNNRIPEAIDYFSQSLTYCPEHDVDGLKKRISSSVAKLSLAMIKMKCSNYISLPSEENASSIVIEARNSLLLTAKLISQCGTTPDAFTADAALAMHNAVVKGWMKIWSEYTEGDKPLQPLPYQGRSSFYSPTDHNRYAHPSKYDWERFTNRADACMSIAEAAIALDQNDFETDITGYENLIAIETQVKDSCSIAFLAGSAYVQSKWCREYSFTDEAKAARQRKIDQWKVKIEETRNAIERKKADTYWGEHPDERANLTNSLNQFKAYRQSLVTGEENRMVVQQLNQLKNGLNGLQRELKALGIFSGGNRKMLKAKIKGMEKELMKAEEKKKALDNEINRVEFEINKLEERLARPC